MVDAGFELYVGEDGPDTLARLRTRYVDLLERNLKDPNIALLLAAAVYLDQLAEKESSEIFEKSKDPESLVADELIGMSIAEYIAGKRGLFNYTRYDRAKPGILAELPPFLDDAVAALVAGTMTRLFED
jgi:alpha-ribazole phosphatase CobZ